MNRDKILKRFDQIMVFSMCALIYFLPISTALIESWIGVAVFVLFIKRLFVFNFDLKDVASGQGGVPLSQRGKLFLKIFQPKPNFLNKSLGIYIFINFIVLFFSQYPAVSVKAFICKLIQGWGVYFVFLECMDTPKRLKAFLITFFASVLLVTVNGLVQYFNGRGFTRGFLLMAGRVSSSFKHSNDFAAYLIVTTLLLFNIVKEGAKSMKARMSCFLLFLLSMICLGLTYSRGAWLGFFTALLFVACYQKKKWYLPLAICIIFLMVFAPMMMKSRDVFFVQDNVEQSKLEGNTPIVWGDKVRNILKGLGGSGRNKFWQEAMTVIRVSPVWGTGLNTYSLTAPQYGKDWSSYYVHNCYLQMIAEIGLVGLGGFLWVIISLYGMSFKFLDRIKSKFGRSVIVGSLTGLLAFLIHGAFDTNFYAIQLTTLMWLIMGLIVACQKIYLKESD